MNTTNKSRTYFEGLCNIKEMVQRSDRKIVSTETTLEGMETAYTYIKAGVQYRAYDGMFAVCITIEGDNQDDKENDCPF